MTNLKEVIVLSSARNFRKTIMNKPGNQVSDIQIGDPVYKKMCPSLFSLFGVV